MARRRGARNPRPQPRHPLDRNRPCGRFRCADARQPPQCRRADRRSPRRPLLFDRRPLREWRLPHRRQAAEGLARRLRLHVDLGAGGAARGVAAANHFELGLGRPEYLLLAGGIGITPVFTHALALARAGVRFRMLYACRRRRDAALEPELTEAIGDRLSLFVGEDGARVDIAAEIAALDPQGEFYVCGPIGMLEDAKKAWA